MSAIDDRLERALHRDPRQPYTGAAECAEDGCHSDAHTRGLCSKHYNRQRRAAMRAGTWVPVPQAPPVDSEEPVCTCAVARPDGIGECATCRRVVIASMAPAIRVKALVRWPHLAGQTIGGAA
jgi:hypothetical protein